MARKAYIVMVYIVMALPWHERLWRRCVSVKIQRHCRGATTKIPFFDEERRQMCLFSVTSKPSRLQWRQGAVLWGVVTAHAASAPRPHAGGNILVFRRPETRMLLALGSRLRMCLSSMALMAAAIAAAPSGGAGDGNSEYAMYGTACPKPKPSY